MWGEVDNNRSFVGLQDKVQHSWNLLGRWLGW